MTNKSDSLNPEILALMEPKASQVCDAIRDSVNRIAAQANTIRLFAEAGRVGTYDASSPRGRALSRLGDAIDVIEEVSEMGV